MEGISLLSDVLFGDGEGVSVGVSGGRATVDPALVKGGPDVGDDSGEPIEVRFWNSM